MFFGLSLILVAYVFGSIPFGLLIGRRIGGTDVRSAGSGNIGATNVGRLLGKKWGLVTLFCDMNKAMIPVGLSKYLLRGAPNSEVWVSLVGLAAFLGHLFPVYLKFKGGKGVATALGVFLTLAPGAALCAVGLFALSAGLSGYVSVGSLTAASAMPFLVWFFGDSGVYVWLAAVVALCVWIKHRDNIHRLLNRTEKSLRQQ